ncbi:UDP-N-acetylmuramoyl-tripeptide--D-alanyl-D-alanine ligase [Thermovirga lienii]|uniref:UDP-N-acetylmuramoyl-tripeptide--D-alanyl-D- alanine ligase n=1 Tax=Thermovirga lienii TaxID=336261 RepID=UPI002FDFF829
MELARFVSLEEVAEVLNAKFIKGKKTFLGTPLSVDTRTMKEGQGFIALKGSKVDGHKYVKDAIDKNASYLIVEEAKLDEILPTAIQKQVSLLAVKDTSLALKKLAQFIFSEKSNLKEVISITGTAGKTTTRECLAAALGSAFKVHSAIKSYNTWIGCALTIASMPIDTEILILEMGTNHPGEIMEMVELFPPSIGVITSVGPGHLEGLGDINGVIKAKSELLASNKLHTFYYNADIPLLEEAVENYPSTFEKIGVGFERGKVRLAVERFFLNEEGANLRVTVSEKDMNHVFDSLLFGLQNAYSIGFAVSVSRHLSLEVEDIAEALKRVSPLDGRGKIGKTLRGAVYIDETYNANPLSLKAAMDNLKMLEVKGKKILVLGSMKELGEYSAYWHQVILEEANFADLVVLVGDEWPSRDLGPNFVKCESNQEAALLLREKLNPEDVVLLKGSRSNKLEEIIYDLRGL